MTAMNSCVEFAGCSDVKAPGLQLVSLANPPRRSPCNNVTKFIKMDLALQKCVCVYLLQHTQMRTGTMTHTSNTSHNAMETLRRNARRRVEGIYRQ